MAHTIAALAAVKLKPLPERADLPKAVPTETDDPDRVVTRNDTKEPKQDDPKIPTIQAEPSNESVAAEATAAPTLHDAPQSPRSIAPAQGTGENARRERAAWRKELAAHFNKYKRYPPDRSAQRAQVVVSFVLDRTGHLLSTRVVEGSGHPSFDAAALAMLQRSDPAPPPPR